jgi:hypothetical protein
MSSNERIFDRSTYSTNTITTYSIIAAYVVDIYYNHLYDKACILKNNGDVPSITEGYRHAVYALLSAIDNKSTTYKPKYYTDFLKGINQAFETWTNFGVLDLSECIFKITKEFVPKDYHRSLNKDQRRHILRSVITNTMREFSKAVISEYLNHIVDNYGDSTNIQLLQERFIDICLLERENCYTKFLSAQTGSATEKVDKHIVEKMRRELQTHIKEKLEYKKYSEHVTNEYKKVLIQLKKLYNKYRRMETEYKGLKKEHSLLKEKYHNMYANEDYEDHYDNTAEAMNLVEQAMTQSQEEYAPVSKSRTDYQKPLDKPEIKSESDTSDSEIEQEITVSKPRIKKPVAKKYKKLSEVSDKPEEDTNAAQNQQKELVESKKEEDVATAGTFFDMGNEPTLDDF